MSRRCRGVGLAAQDTTTKRRPPPPQEPDHHPAGHTWPVVGPWLPGVSGEPNVYVEPTTLDATPAAELAGALPDINGSVSL